MTHANDYAKPLRVQRFLLTAFRCLMPQHHGKYSPAIPVTNPLTFVALLRLLRRASSAFTLFTIRDTTYLNIPCSQRPRPSVLPLVMPSCLPPPYLSPPVPILQA